MKGGRERPPPSPSLEEDQYETAEGKAAKGDPTNLPKIRVESSRGRDWPRAWGLNSTGVA